MDVQHKIYKIEDINKDYYEKVELLEKRLMIIKNNMDILDYFIEILEKICYEE